MKLDNLGVEMTDLDTQRSLGRLEGKLDSLILQLTEHIKKDEVAWARVNSLDRRLIWFSGVFAAAAFFIGGMVRKVLGL